MIKLTKEKVLMMHKYLCEETGGSNVLRDESLLEFAVEAAFSGFGGKEFYRSKEEKAYRVA